jgi:uncharacterized protein YifE (UPF0438 family)
MDELKRLVDNRNQKHLAFIIKARDLSLKELYLMTTYGRKIEQLEAGDMGVN